MQLVSMDVTRVGSNDRVQIGPFSSGLNAICGPQGAGKTTLMHWIRRTVGSDPAGNNWITGISPADFFGRVTVRNGEFGATVEQTRDGQLRVCHEHASRPNTHHVAYRTQGVCNPLSQDQQRLFAELTGIHHGVNDIQRLEALARQLEIDRPQISSWHSERGSLLARQSEIHNRLRTIEGIRSTREGLLSKRGHLEAELHRVRAELGNRNYNSRPQLEERRNALASELRDVRGEIAALDREISAHRGGWSLRRGYHGLDIGITYREQLEQLDARLDRWRQTLRDLRTHRERLEHNATDARLDMQIGDQLSIAKVPDPRSALRSLESHILTASRQLDSLVDRLDRSYESQTVQQTLPETLRQMQRDLYEVCQQLARHESTAAAQTLRQQATQLARCEAELLQSVEKLIEERSLLLRRIAEEYHLSMDQLTLAFGDWCQCHDHPHLSQWLLNEGAGDFRRKGLETSSESLMVAEARVWETRRQDLQSRESELLADLKDVESHLASSRFPESQKHLRTEAEILDDLTKVNAELTDLEDRDRLRVELDEIRRTLAKLPVDRGHSDRFQTLVNRHLDQLTAGELRVRQPWTNRHRLGDFHLPVQESHFGSTRFHRDSTQYANGSSENRPWSRSAVPSGLVELAMRLAIAEVLSERGQGISLVVDGALDHLSPELQRASVKHLNAVAQSGQQVVLLTSDQRVAELVRSAQGWIGYMDSIKAHSAPAPARNGTDVNRHLLAVANEFEADKWREPVVSYRSNGSLHRATNGYYLTEATLIEDCPSMDAMCAARCRALGIDRVGDLLATDPHWLAEHLRINGVTSSTVMRWQAEARLLSAVRQLRPFDARVLAGAGVRTPRQLAEMHPSQLLDRVERFLATDRGREILRSGNSYELTRITSWIASAKSGEMKDRSNTRRSSNWQYSEEPMYITPRARVDYDGVGDDYDDQSQNGAGDRTQYRTAGHPSERRYQESSEYQRSIPISRHAESTSRSESSRAQANGRTAKPRREGRDAPNKQRTTASRSTGNGRNSAASNSGWRFYLDLNSAVVDAPSIGPKVAAKMEAIGIRSIEQLINASAESIANRLDMRRIDSEVIRSWQEQAILVCRIPNLRGHDAQLLVAADINSPEALAQMDASSVLSSVQSIARSQEGQRILRGSQEPDLAEVKDWIHWAANSRSLNAA